MHASHRPYPPATTICTSDGLVSGPACATPPTGSCTCCSMSSSDRSHQHLRPTHEPSRTETLRTPSAHMWQRSVSKHGLHKALGSVYVQMHIRQAHPASHASPWHAHLLSTSQGWVIVQYLQQYNRLCHLSPCCSHTHLLFALQLLAKRLEKPLGCSEGCAPSVGGGLC